MSSHWLELSIVNSYFDFNDISNPVKTYYEDTNFYNLVPSYPYYLDVRVAYNEYQADDNLVFQGITRSGNFYNVQSKEARPDNYNFGEPGKIITTFIQLTSQYQYYERKAFSFFDMFGLLGGLFGILKIIGGLIVARFTERLFELSILSNLYQVNSPTQQTKTSKVLPIDEEIVQDKDKRITTPRNLISKLPEENCKIDNINEEVIENQLSMTPEI